MSTNSGWLKKRKLKGLKLTIRNAPMGQTGCDDGPCIFTGREAVERVLIGRAY